MDPMKRSHCPSIGRLRQACPVLLSRKPLASAAAAADPPTPLLCLPTPTPDTNAAAVPLSLPRYEMDGQTQVRVFGQAYAIPGPDNPTDDCPFCGPPLPDNATRWMRKGYYLAVTWIDYLAGQIIGELETLGHKDDTVIALVGDHGACHSLSTVCIA